MMLVENMNLRKLAASIVLTSFFIGCAGTVEDSAWIRGVSREDALDIRQAIQALHPGCKIYEYSRDESGGVDVRADCGTWIAKRVRGKWQFTPTVITS
jgi:hypothetical protein